jgi:hypothetical protein
MKHMPLFLIAMAAAPGAAHAQDAPKVGLTMGYPGSIGVLWRVADRVAVRPEITLSRSTGEARGSDLAGVAPSSTDESTGVGAGISALFYVRRSDALRAYVSPRFAYTRASTSASTGGSTVVALSTSNSTFQSYLTSGSFGAQYALGRRFGVFGEVGVSYSRTSTAVSSTFTTGLTTFVNGVVTQSTRAQTISSSGHSSTIAARSGVGVIIFF